MANVTVTICDVCKDRIAAAACPVCAKDLCKPCTKTVAVEMGVRFGPKLEFFKGTMCSGCYKKVENNYRHVITQLSSEVEPGVLKVLRTVVGEGREITTSPEAPTVEPTPQLQENFDSRGGFERAEKDETDSTRDVTNADIPEGLDVTKDL
jgi:hypothetical protein